MNDQEISPIAAFWSDLVSQRERVLTPKNTEMAAKRVLKNSFSYGSAIIRQPKLELGEDKIKIPEFISSCLQQLSQTNGISKLRSEAEKSICRVKIRFASESIGFLQQTVAELHKKSEIINSLGSLNHIYLSPILPIIHKANDIAEEGTFHNDYFPDSNAGTRIAWVALTNYQYPGIHLKTNKHLLRDKLLDKLRLGTIKTKFNMKFNQYLEEITNLRDNHEPGDWATWNDTLTHKGILNKTFSTSSAAIIRFSQTQNSETFLKSTSGEDTQASKIANDQLVTHSCLLINNAIDIIESSPHGMIRSLSHNYLKKTYSKFDIFSLIKILNMTGFGIKLIIQRLDAPSFKQANYSVDVDAKLLLNASSLLTAIHEKERELLSSL